MSSLEPFHVTADLQVLDASSVIRLPFEPKGDSLLFRQAIRAGLGGLEATGVLHATYGSSVRAACDVENVLLYNVGMSHFRRLTTRGLVFERTFDAGTDGRTAHAHRYRYEAVHEPVVRHWSVGPPVASWMAVMPERSADKPASWWWSVVRALQPCDAMLDAGASFALDVQVGPTRRSLCNMLKPMFDGAIAACHSDASPDPVAVERVGRSIGVTPSEVAAALASTPAPLGDHRVVRRYRENVQWHPADDNCVVGRVVIDDHLPPGSFAGTLRPVGPCH